MPETLQRKRRRRRLTLLALALACCAPSPTLAHDARRHGSVALRPRHGHHDAAAVHHRRTSPSAHANASAVVDASASLAKGRFGHSSVYLPDSNQVLFVGGQIGKLSSDGETLITNDVLALNLSAPFDSAAHQPSESPDLAKLVMPQAWAATAVDRMGNVWTIGGLTQDCAADAVASVLDVTHETSAPALAGRAATSGPPRRRQAHAVALADSTGGDNATDIYVWGGLAEPYTCSIDTVGYLAMDIWSSSTSGRSVRTVQFKTPKDAPERYRPPISDYATAALDDGRIVVIGGQTTDGSLTPMNRVLVFDPVASNWSIIVRRLRYRLRSLARSSAEICLSLESGMSPSPCPAARRSSSMAVSARIAYLALTCTCSTRPSRRSGRGRSHPAARPAASPRPPSAGTRPSACRMAMTGRCWSSATA